MDFDTLSSIHISLLLSGFLFELQVAKVHYASSQLVHAHLLLGGEAQDIKGFLWIQQHGESQTERTETRAAAPHTEKQQHHQLADAVIDFFFPLDMQSSDSVFVADFK